MTSPADPKRSFGDFLYKEFPNFRFAAEVLFYEIVASLMSQVSEPDSQRDNPREQKEEGAHDEHAG